MPRMLWILSTPDMLRQDNLNNSLKTQTKSKFLTSNLNKQLMRRQSTTPLRKLLSLQSVPWWRNMTLRDMLYMTWILLRPDRSPQDSSSNWLMMRTMNTCQLSNLNKLLKRRPRMNQLHKRLSLLKDPRLRKMTLLDKLNTRKIQ